MSCFKRTNTKNEYEETSPIYAWGNLVENTDLTGIQKKAIRIRVLSVVKRLRERLFRLTIGYTLLRTSTTVGSLLVPSLLAVQSNVDQLGAYWAMWGIGLTVSLSNAFISLFRIDKNYFTVGDLIEKIESESWMYLTLSGRYKIDDQEYITDGITGHRSFFSLFMERCEAMINKAVRTEYIPGQVPSSIRSVANDQHSFLDKQINRSAIREPYETVPVQIDDNHDRSVSNSGDSVVNIREYRSSSDSTIESGGGVPARTNPVVSTTEGSGGV